MNLRIGLRIGKRSIAVMIEQAISPVWEDAFLARSCSGFVVSQSAERAVGVQVLYVHTYKPSIWNGQLRKSILYAYLATFRVIIQHYSGKKRRRPDNGDLENGHIVRIQLHYSEFGTSCIIVI